MDGALFTIGDLARRTGLTVKTVRFYSDSGIVPPTTRSAGGYRLYDVDALARLDLVRTLRELGLDLPAVRRVLDQQSCLPEVAAAHAEALEVQIRTLRQRRAVLRAVAHRGPNPEEIELMHKLARLSEAERRRLITDFIDDTFGGLDANPEFVAMLRASMPDLPEDPEPEQVDAWVELAELVQDPDFRAAVRAMAQFQAAERAAGDTTGLHLQLTEEVRDRVSAAIDAGIDPHSPAAVPVADALAARYAEVFDRPDDLDLRRWMLSRLEVASDPRAERYLQLLARVNGWPVPPTLVLVFSWLIGALRTSTEVRVG